MVGDVQSVILCVWIPTAAEAGRAAVEEEPEEVSIPVVIRPGPAAPRETGRRSLLLTEMLREARAIAKAVCGTHLHSKQ